MMQKYCKELVRRDGKPDQCGRVLNIDGTCCNGGKHVGSKKL